MECWSSGKSLSGFFYQINSIYSEKYPTNLIFLLRHNLMIYLTCDLMKWYIVDRLKSGLKFMVIYSNYVKIFLRIDDVEEAWNSNC